MPNKISISPPPPLGPENRELYSYLYKLVEQLNICLSSIEAEHQTMDTRLSELEKR